MRETAINIRLSIQEKQQLEALAKKANLGVSEFVRVACGLGKLETFEPAKDQKQFEKKPKKTFYSGAKTEARPDCGSVNPKLHQKGCKR